MARACGMAVGGRREGGTQGAQVHLLAQPLGERRPVQLPVVSGPVEPAVHGPLDPPAERLEQRERHERGRGHGERARRERPPSTACRPTTTPRTPHQDPVTIAQPIVRLMIRSISYSR